MASRNSPKPIVARVFFHQEPRNKNTAITQALSSWWQPGYYRAWNVSMMSHCAVQITAKSGCLCHDSSRLFSQADFVRARRGDMCKTSTFRVTMCHPCIVFNRTFIPFFLLFSPFLRMYEVFNVRIQIWYKEGIRTWNYLVFDDYK